MSKKGTRARREGPRGITRQQFLIASAGAGAGLLLSPGGLLVVDRAGAAAPALETFQGGYPRAFFFRQPERDAREGTLSYAEWEKRFLPLGGIMGKALNEEHDYSQKDNLAFFRQYKMENPGKVVFLHYNGTGRRPTDEATTRFFPGHWLHYRGTRLTESARKSRSVTTLRVADTSVFRMRRSEGVNDDIAVSLVDGAGRPVWGKTEQVRLEAINPKSKTISVQRGAYGTPLRYFPKGSYLAAHVITGPYPYNDSPEENTIPLWSYNFSTVGPRDPNGRTGGEALVDYLVGKLGPGGPLSFFDGISLDVFNFVARFGSLEEVDANGDGRPDGGIVGGKNVYGLGALRFSKALRERLPGKIILADGQFTTFNQRSFGHLNGIETEGYPDLKDYELNNLSRGQNVFNFWKENGPTPSMNYVNFKYKSFVPSERGRNEFVEPSLSEDRSYEKLRLVLASTTFTDAVFSYAGKTSSYTWAPPETLWREGNAMVRVFDELWQGVDQRPNWLGMPLGPPVFLAEEAPDLLEGQGESWPASFIDRFTGGDAVLSREEGTTGPGMSIRYAGDPSAPALKRGMSFGLPGVRVPAEDLFVTLRLRADALETYPAAVARRVEVTAAPVGGADPKKSFTWANGRPFAATFYFGDVGPGAVDLRFVVEGGRPLRFERLTARPAADVAYRKFENGTVFSNPSTRPHTFDLAKLFPNASFRRIQGATNQDPVTNNGQPLGAKLTLPARDALFVVRAVA